MLKIKHSVNGRTRFKYSLLKQLPHIETALLDTLRASEGVQNVRCNTKGSSVIIKYDPLIINNTQLVKLIRSVNPEECQAPSCELDTSRTRGIKNTHIRKKGFEFAGLSATMVGMFIRSKLMKATLAQGLLSPLGLIGVAFSYPLLRKALKDIKEQRKLTLNSFLAGGVASALIAGEAATALEILWVESGSELISAYVAEKSRKAVRKILEVSEKSAYVIRNGIELEVAIEDICPGDIVTIHTGEKISIDGKVVKGEGMVNEAPINGRSELIHKAADDQVFAGTFVSEGVIYVRAEQVGDTTYLSRILYMVEDSLENKAHIELEADRLAQRLVNIGFFMTAGTFLVTRSLYRAFSVLLVMSCPCATILAASSAVSAALNNAASKGILIKGGRYLEEAGAQSSFCFDKTGTLTNDHPKLTDIYALEGYTNTDVLHAAHIAEMHNRHPLAVAVRTKAEEMGLEHPHHTICNSILGMGARAESEGSEYLIGNNKLMRKFSITVGILTHQKKIFQKQGKTVMYVAKDGNVIGLLCVANSVKSNIPELISELRNDGVKELILLTGDERESAQALAEELNFDRYYASVLPEEKSKVVETIQDEHKVAMVGDGINDVLALATSDLGIAMGALGSDVAIEAADIALVDDDLEKIVYLRKLSHQTKNIINQNFMLATGSNIVGAAFGLFGLLNPIAAGLIHIAHTMGVVANSSRLLAYNPKMITNPEEENNNAG